MPSDPGFWEASSTVERFASLEPDDLMLALVAECRGAGPFRALDLGCAGGRNAEALVRAGCETWALDLSTAMTRATRRRLLALDPVGGPRPIVMQARFSRLPLVDAAFDLVVGIGIYIQADTDAELRTGLAETYRVLVRGGHVFAALWSTQTLPPDARRVDGQRFIYATQPGETRCRLNRDELVALMAEAGLALDRPVTTRRSLRDDRPHESLVGVFVKR